jgi:hypothetical protein
MSIFGGGGSAPAPASAPSVTTQYLREAPGIEERKLGLMDIAAQLGQTPVNIPDIQVAGLGGLEQQGITASGITGVGQPTVSSAVTGAQTAMAPVGQAEINQYLNPYQSYVTDEITRQSQMRQNQLAAQAVGSGAFGGGREGVRIAEEERARLANIGQSMATGFQTALGAAQRQQQLGLQGSQLLGQLGQQQQGMAQQDINQLMAAGGLQRQLAQQALDAQRQTELQRAYEPYQRAEFVKNIYAAGPTSQSTLTQTSAPTATGSPLAQAAGAGLGAYATYSMLNRNPQAAALAATAR